MPILCCGLPVMTALDELMDEFEAWTPDAWDTLWLPWAPRRTHVYNPKIRYPAGSLAPGWRPKAWLSAETVEFLSKRAPPGAAQAGVPLAARAHAPVVLRGLRPGRLADLARRGGSGCTARTWCSGWLFRTTAPSSTPAASRWTRSYDVSNGFYDQHSSWFPQGAYHPDPEISAEVAADALAGEIADLGAGDPPGAGAARSAVPSTSRGHSGHRPAPLPGVRLHRDRGSDDDD